MTCYVLLTSGGCITPATPFDIAINLAPAPHYPELERPDSDPPTLVVLQHGISRSAWSLWRLERALEQHGYEVLNPGYSSTMDTIEFHAEKLERDLEACLSARTGPTPRIVFVGHSMGGLVVRSYLERGRARTPWACVFVATPHRGAVLASKRESLWVFDLFLGSKASRQLIPTSPFYATLGPLRVERIGCLYGGMGDSEGRNDDIPGDDDGTVGVEEAQLPEQTDVRRLPLGHTALSVSEPALRQILTFVRFGRFDHGD